MSVAQGQSRGKKGNKKHGRDKVKCARYLAKHTREKNKVRRLNKLLRKGERLGWGNVGQIKAAISRADNKIYGA